MGRSLLTSIYGKLSVGAAAIAFLTNCGPGFKMDPTAACGADVQCISGGGNTGPGDNTPPPPDNSGSGGKGATFEGEISEGIFEKTKAVDLDKETKMLKIKLPMMANPYLWGTTAELPIKEIPGAKLTVETAEDGTTSVVLHIPLAALIKGINFPPAAKLPNGDPLPGVPSGELPSLAVQLNATRKINATVYLSKQVVGIYVNTPFDPLVPFKFPIKSKDGKTIGYFFAVPAKKGTTPVDGGFFLTTQLPDDLSRFLDDHI